MYLLNYLTKVLVKVQRKRVNNYIYYILFTFIILNKYLNIILIIDLVKLENLLSKKAKTKNFHSKKFYDVYFKHSKKFDVQDYRISTIQKIRKKIYNRTIL